MTIHRSAGLAALLTLSAFGVTAAAQDDSETTRVDSVQVTASTLPGWTVSDADSKLFVLLVPDVMPSSIPWNRAVLESKIEGANRVIKAFDVSMLDPRSLLGMAGALLQTPKLAFVDRPERVAQTPPLEASLPPDLRARFVAAREALGQPAERYAAMSPIKAATTIQADYRRHHGLASRVVMQVVDQAAERHKVKVQAVYTVTIPIGNLAVSSTSETTGEEAFRCLDAALTRMVERGEDERRIALAWSKGDLGPLAAEAVRGTRPKDEVRATISNGTDVSPSCTNATVTASVSSGTSLNSSFQKEAVSAFERALKTPGYAVAVFDHPTMDGADIRGVLLGPQGVLEQLKAKGYQVESPRNFETSPTTGR